MTKLRVFISSTYYDLKYIRKNLESFIEQMGYDPVLFESGDIPFQHDLPLDESCYKELKNCHMQILIIGGRYGSPTSDIVKGGLEKIDKNKMYEYYNSITKAEYEKALEKSIPVFVFIEKTVYAEYHTYKKNKKKKNITYAHVDSVNIFKLIEEIIAKKRGNYIKEFEGFEDIQSWLKDQWAGLFADFLTRKSSELEFRTLSSQISELSSITNAMKQYTEALMRKIRPDDYSKIIKEGEKRIDLTKLKRLLREPMIEYIIQSYSIRIPDRNILFVLRKSKTIEDFLLKIGFSTDEIKNFLMKHKDYVREDFKKLKIRYSEQGSDQIDDSRISELNNEEKK